MSSDENLLFACVLTDGNYVFDISEKASWTTAPPIDLNTKIVVRLTFLVTELSKAIILSSNNNYAYYSDFSQVYV